MIIRKFVSSDIKRVLEIEHMSFEDSYGFNMFMKLYEMGVGFLVAEKEGYVVGYILFWVKYEREGHIISIAVDKNYKRLKIGTKLLSNAIMILNQCDIDYITLEVRENNKGALEFYKNFNFTVDRVVPCYYSNKEGAVIMRLKLIH